MRRDIHFPPKPRALDQLHAITVSHPLQSWNLVPGYVLLYSVYYFVVKTKMSGFFQTVFYFGAPRPE